MPEGDTIFRLARALAPDLEGQRIERAWLRETGPLGVLEGEVGREVRSLGKHLLVGIGPDWLLRTHLGMDGDLHRYGPAEAWNRPRSAAVASLVTEARCFVWFEPAEAELFRAADLPRHPRLSRLGPDLLGSKLEVGAVVERARARGGDRVVSELLLDQTVAAGIGNIYKCEVLFVAGVSPFRRLDEISDPDLSGLYLTARELLHRNVGTGPRATRSGSGPGGAFLPGEPRLWVYGRAGQVCLVCGNAVRTSSQTDQRRVTYFCPSCQG